MSKLPVIPWANVPRKYICHVFDGRGKGWFSIGYKFDATEDGFLLEVVKGVHYPDEIPHEHTISSGLIGPKTKDYRSTLQFRPGHEPTEEEIKALTECELIVLRLKEIRKNNLAT